MIYFVYRQFEVFEVYSLRYTPLQVQLYQVNSCFEADGFHIWMVSVCLRIPCVHTRAEPVIRLPITQAHMGHMTASDQIS